MKTRITWFNLVNVCVLTAGAAFVPSAHATSPGSNHAIPATSLEMALERAIQEKAEVTAKLKNNYSQFQEILPEVKTVMNNKNSKAVASRGLKTIIADPSKMNGRSSYLPSIYAPNDPLKEIATSGSALETLQERARNNLRQAEHYLLIKEGRIERKYGITVGRSEFKSAVKIKNWFHADPDGLYRHGTPEWLLSPKMKKLANAGTSESWDLMGFGGRDDLIELAERQEEVLAAQKEVDRLSKLKHLPNAIERNAVTAKLATFVEAEASAAQQLRKSGFTEVDIGTIIKKEVSVIGRMKSILKIVPAVAILGLITAEAMGETQVQDQAVNGGNVQTKTPSSSQDQPGKTPSGKGKAAE